MTSGSVLIALAAFVAMEPITAATHRWIMHGLAEFLHRSHHQARVTRLERNDWFPVMFAAIVMLGFLVGFNVDGFAALIPVGIGITAYGAAYAFVHDVVIHGRAGWVPRRRVAVLDHLADAHRIHHLYNAAPYGMLVPVVPRHLRERAAATTRDPLARL